MKKTSNLTKLRTLSISRNSRMISFNDIKKKHQRYLKKKNVSILITPKKVKQIKKEVFDF